MEAYLARIYSLVELARQTLPFGGWELVFVGILFFSKQIFRLIRSAIFFGIVIALIGGVLLKYTDLLDSTKNQLLHFVKEKAKKHLSQAANEASSKKHL